MANIKITLTKSLIGRFRKHIATAHSLGLYKIGDTAVCKKDPAIDGKVTSISYLISVEEVK